jgi:hypothetical protein
MTEAASNIYRRGSFHVTNGIWAELWADKRPDSKALIYKDFRRCMAERVSA